jgi:ribosomal-protein-alanine N-acetyltransferase
MFKIRPAQLTDLGKIHEIELECFGKEGVSLDQLTWILDKQGDDPVIHLNVAMDDEDPSTMLGFICWKSQATKENPHFEILDLGVAKLYRREGAAQALIENLIEHAREKNHLGLVVYLSEGNPPALAMYEKLGFKVQKVMKAYYQNGENALLMVYTLI